MGPVSYVIAILGCADGAAACQQVALAPARYESAAACEATGERALRLTITEGRYHQVKRMIAAVGNSVA